MFGSARSRAAGPRTLRERGAVAVEMAIVLPLLILIIGGMVDLGRLFFVQSMVTNAAREGARMKALGYTDADATSRVNAASPTLDPAVNPNAAAWGGPMIPTYTACPAAPTAVQGASATVTTTDFEWLILGNMAKWFGATATAPEPTSTASMRCYG